MITKEMRQNLHTERGAIDLLVKPGNISSDALSRPGAVGKLLTLHYRARI